MANHIATELQLKKIIKEAAAALKAEPKKHEVRRGLGAGLILVVTPRGQSYRAALHQMASVDGRTKTFILGEYPEIGLAAARRKGAEELERRKTEAARVKDHTLVQVLEEYLTAKAETLAPGSMKMYRVAQRQLAPLHDRPVTEIAEDHTQARNVLEGIASANSKGRTLMLLRQVMDYAVISGYIKSHSVNLLGRLPQFKSPPSEGHAFLTADKLKAGFFSRLIYETDYLKAVYLAMFMLPCRIAELLSLRWEHIHPDDRQAPRGVIIIPKELTKTKHGDHVLPITEEAEALLAWIKEHDYEPGYVFHGLHDRAAPMPRDIVRRPVTRYTDHTIHGTRKTFSTFIAENARAQGFDLTAAELILHHVPRGISATAFVYNKYDYLPEQLQILSFWHKWLRDNALTPEFSKLLEG